MEIFEQYESNVRAYCRNFYDVFDRAKGALIYSESGKKFVDFFAGAGALNYGHNNEYIKQKILAYLESDSITHGLDMYTKAKREFIEKFSQIILEPRKLNYKIQFCGPTGTNAVEASLKLARKITKRTGIFAFMGGFHGMSLGSLAVTSNIQKRSSSGIALSDVTFFPYSESPIDSFDTIEYMEVVLNDGHSGIEKPAAIIFETIQAEGGVNIASPEWMLRLRELSDRHGILLICDDIQVGCGRTGPFFSFERAGMIPDIVLLSKSISGYGLPMSILLMKPELDVWKPGEHNGTFRGNQLAFIGATAALEYWEMNNLEQSVKYKEAFVREYLTKQILSLHKGLTIRGAGLIWGIDFSNVEDERITQKVVEECYQNGLIIESAGRKDSVIKLMPPLTIELELLQQGCSIIRQAIQENINKVLEVESYG
ncbi:Diaminobutyrate--2-oxoglutarate transaminase [Paenibacillus polymyxa]|uniref:diaminobutyrate--2-oxoglutarate transaminase n=1 Tax=Paenibacillus polymyxa TaxID=1406 RepID=UPI0009474377|nr:diaminobutyrate--2-oxoglutarate transaminase [Paenibacillus polymyxa]APQ59551.1 diadenosine tetraphosphatase [Paenibacillus polymyxa]VUG07448.1 Diaminobutyrate--2-oxoglutarate transaminase [Paenibacillus polymyxa]